MTSTRGSSAAARPTRRPPGLFAIPFGLAGLAVCWLVAGRMDLAPVAVGGVLLAVSGAVWIAVLVAYVRGLRPVGAALRQDLADRTAGPFLPLAVLTPVVVAAQGVHPLSPAVGRLLVDVLLVLVLLLGAWFTGDWIFGSVGRDQIHPGWFVPTVAGGIIAASAAAAVDRPAVALGLFGMGVVSWAMLGPVVLARLVTGPLLTVALRPALAIEVAPAAVASTAWFALNGERIDLLAMVLGGYGLVMVLAQVRLLPLFLHLPVMPSTWAFVFSWAAVVTAALHWLTVLAPAGSAAWAYALLAAVTALGGGVAVRTVVALVQRRLVPSRPAVDVEHREERGAELT